MDAFALAKAMGFTGDCTERLVDFIADPTAWITTPGAQARVALFLRDVADGLLAQAKDAADTEMGSANVLEDGGVLFERRAPTKAQVVNVAAVKAIYPQADNPLLYKEQVRRGSIAAKLVDTTDRMPAETTGMPWD